MSGQGTVPSAILREGQVGPELAGEAGQFLAFDTDGRHVKGVAAPTGGGAFVESVSASQATATPALEATLAADPAAFTGLNVAGWVYVTWTNNEATDASIGGNLTFEGSLDGGVTWTAIGDPVQFSGFNPSTAAVQFVGITIPVVWSTKTGPATGAVKLRATLVDQSSGAALGQFELTATGTFTL